MFTPGFLWWVTATRTTSPYEVRLDRHFPHYCSHFLRSCSNTRLLELSTSKLLLSVSCKKNLTLRLRMESADVASRSLRAQIYFRANQLLGGKLLGLTAHIRLHRSGLVMQTSYSSHSSFFLSRVYPSAARRRRRRDVG